MNLLPHQQRVVDEKAELDKKIVALEAFLPTETCLDLPFDERSRLASQLRVMEAYSAILGERIEAFRCYAYSSAPRRQYSFSS